MVLSWFRIGYIIIAQVAFCGQAARFDTRKGECYIGINNYRRPRGLRIRLFQLDKKMNIGVCRIHIRLPENLSLKGKRQVLKSITSRVRNKFNISVAEVDNHDRWQLATIGICCVSNEKRHANEVLSKVVDFVINSRFEVEILDYEIEILAV